MIVVLLIALSYRSLKWKSEMEQVTDKPVVVKFNKQDRPEFYKLLRKRVNKHFKENNISRHANLNMKIKTVFMLSSYFIPLFVLISGSVNNVWTMIGLWTMMGFGMSGIGLSIMHDANHGSYSASKRVNKIIGFVITFIGGYDVNWKIQHNVLHHSFTNIHGFDEDIEKGIIRFSPTQERKPIFKYQAFYAPLLYGIMTIYWFTAKDFEQLFRYKKKNLFEGQGLTFNQALTQIIIVKLIYLVLTFVVPLIVLPFAWWKIVLGFLLMHFISGLILALIFQPAHVIEETEFFMPDKDISVENNWAIHQLLTTSNFAHKSRIFSWLVGGLNFQVEHHLFPNICHVHYRKLSKIVKQTAEEYNIPYYQHETFLGAVTSHFKLLHSLGTGSYDKKLQKA